MVDVNRNKYKSIYNKFKNKYNKFKNYKDYEIYLFMRYV